mgnify:CR=1 FL=1
MKTTVNPVLNSLGEPMKHILLSCTFIFLSICGPACSEGNSDCTDCGGGLIDGYLYKEVTVNDIGSLAEIDISAEVGSCIRFKMDGSDFDNAAIVDDCCCIEFQ